MPGSNERERVAIERAALAQNFIYVRDFVEGWGLCPYSREARRLGQTSRYVHFQTTTDLSELTDLFVDIAEDPRQIVAQIIFPDLRVEPLAWIDFCHQLTRAGHARRGGPDVLANAALHPSLPYSKKSAFALIPLFRRAPDPTIQLVRLSELERLYEGRQKGSTFVDPSDIHRLLEAAVPKSLYDRVAEANQQTANRLGIAHIEAELAELHLRTQREYSAIRGLSMA